MTDVMAGAYIADSEVRLADGAPVTYAGPNSLTFIRPSVDYTLPAFRSTIIVSDADMDAWRTLDDARCTMMEKEAEADGYYSYDSDNPPEEYL